ncbi:MAG: hypothetical protein ACFCU3_08460 [Verrucomicrobiales bacterium]
MTQVEERVTALEEALLAFVQQSNRIVATTHEEIAELRETQAETQQLFRKSQEETARIFREAREETDRQFIRAREETNRQIHDAREETNRQIREAREETDRQFLKAREETDRQIREINKRVAEATDNQGLMIENMVWPNLNRIATEAFSGGEVKFQAIRLVRRHPLDRGKSMELDLLAVGATDVLICEAKSKVNAAKVKEFTQRLELFPEFFPEYKDLTIRPMVASIAFDVSVIAHMTARGILALGFGGHTMEVLNPEALKNLPR